MKTPGIISGFWMLASVVLLCGCTTSPEASAEAGAAAAGTSAVHTVRIVQMKFEPAEITVQKGDQIVFFNEDIVVHDVTEETKRAWASPPIPPGESWTLVAAQSDQYFCSIHQVMKGKIVVQ